MGFRPVSGRSHRIWLNYSSSFFLVTPQSFLWYFEQLEGMNLEYSLEGLMLNLKFQYFGQLMWRTNSSAKDPDAGKDWGHEEKGTTEDEMIGWHHRLNGHEFEQTLGDGVGQRSLVCCSPWGHKESDTTEWLNWIECAKCGKEKEKFWKMQVDVGIMRNKP